MPPRSRPSADALVRRVYCDYVERERLDEFETLLHCALEEQYETVTLSAFAEVALLPERGGHDRILLLRHDIDSDVPRARRMWEIERRLHVVGSYFFRLCTWDIEFMRQLSWADCEVGYHYEELATVVKERGAATTSEARELCETARGRLTATVGDLRARSGLAVDVFAAHGDFANRAVGVSNQELLADPVLRKQLGVRLEAYDIEQYVSARSTDGVSPGAWWPTDPADALRRHEPVVEVLVHPRAWGAAPAVNARADVRRIGEGCAYRARCARRRYSIAEKLVSRR